MYGSAVAPLHTQLTELPIGSGLWVGYSLGGMRLLAELLSGQSANGKPSKSRPEALVLISSTLSFCQREAAPYGTPVAQLRGIRAGLAKDPHKVRATFAKHCWAPQSPPEFWEKLLHEDVERLTAGCNDLIDFDFTGESFAALQDLPVLVLHGAEDLVTSPQAAVALAAALGTTPVFADGAGHALPISHADWCAAAITAFVECLS